MNSTIEIYQCRTCLNYYSYEKVFSLFIKNELISTLTWADLLKECAFVQTEDYNLWPQHICQTCQEKLKTAYSFKKQCEKSTEILEKNSKKIDQIKLNSNEQRMISKIENSYEIENINSSNIEFNQNELIKSPPKKSWSKTCCLCHVNFKSINELQIHVITLHFNKVNCKECQRTYSNYRALKRHFISSHIKSKDAVFKCYQCQYELSSQRQLLDHINQNHQNDDTETINNLLNKNKYECPDCDQSGFKKKSELTAHRQTHTTDDKSLKCKFCNKLFFSQSELKIHMDSEKKIKKYLCPHCGKSFRDRTNLVVHIRTHTGERPYKCKECGKQFAQWSTLRSHKATHSEERNLECNLCSMTFRISQNLRRHMRRHLEEKYFFCDFCGNKYKDSSTLKVHIDSTHSGIKHKCNFCDKDFAYKKGLIVHLRTHFNEKPFTCDICSRGFTQRHCLISHKNTHHSVVKEMNKGKNS